MGIEAQSSHLRMSGLSRDTNWNSPPNPLILCDFELIKNLNKKHGHLVTFFTFGFKPSRNRDIDGESTLNRDISQCPICADTESIIAF